MTRLYIFKDIDTRDRAFNSKLRTLKVMPGYEVKVIYPQRILKIKAPSGKEEILHFRQIGLNYNFFEIEGILADEVHAENIYDLLNEINRQIEMIKIRSRIKKEKDNEDFNLGV